MGEGIPGGMAIILACAAVTYLTRVTGFYLVGRNTPPILDRFLGMVPIAAFAALAVPDLLSGTAPPAQILAGVACGAVILTTRKLWLGLLVGLAIFALLRLV